MADFSELAVAQLHPAEVAQGHALLVVAVAGNEGGIEIGGAGAITAKAEPLPLASLELVMHVAEHHQRQRALPANAIDRQGQILITPVAGRCLPVAAAGIVRGAAEAAGPAMGEQDQRQGRIRRQGRRRRLTGCAESSPWEDVARDRP